MTRISIQWIPDLVTNLVSDKSATKSRHVTKFIPTYTTISKNGYLAAKLSLYQGLSLNSVSLNQGSTVVPSKSEKKLLAGNFQKIIRFVARLFDTREYMLMRPW